jgi:hypothetical protein
VEKWVERSNHQVKTISGCVRGWKRSDSLMVFVSRTVNYEAKKEGKKLKDYWTSCGRRVLLPFVGLWRISKSNNCQFFEEVYFRKCLNCHFDEFNECLLRAIYRHA